MKLCINCKHFAMEKHTISQELGRCTVNRTTSLVTGLLTTLETLPFCVIQRSTGKPCGHDGLLFVEKEAGNV